MHHLQVIRQEHPSRLNLIIHTLLIIKTNFCLYVSINRIESIALFIIRYLIHWAARDDLPSIQKHKYYLPAGCNYFVVCNSTGVIGCVAFNGVKIVVVYVD